MTEIIPKLFVGTREDAVALGAVVPPYWLCLAVTEYRNELPSEPIGSIDMQFMDRKLGCAMIDKLDAIAEQIELGLGSFRKVLVHCVHAHERSPLAIVWYLAWSGRFLTIDAAYEYVVKVHPGTERRDKWLRGATPNRGKLGAS
jgi:hypothetical protein